MSSIYFLSSLLIQGFWILQCQLQAAGRLGFQSTLFQYGKSVLLWYDYLKLPCGGKKFIDDWPKIPQRLFKELGIPLPISFWEWIFQEEETVGCQFTYWSDDQFKFKESFKSFKSSAIPSFFKRIENIKVFTYSTYEPNNHEHCQWTMDWSHKTKK